MDHKITIIVKNHPKYVIEEIMEEIGWMIEDTPGVQLRDFEIEHTETE